MAADPPNDHTRVRTALRHPFVQPGVTETGRGGGGGNRSLSNDGLGPTAEMCERSVCAQLHAEKI